jgi:hypothetical protein
MHEQLKNFKNNYTFTALNTELNFSESSCDISSDCNKLLPF